MNQPSPMNITPGTTPGATPTGTTPNGAGKPKMRRPPRPKNPADLVLRANKRPRRPGPEDETRQRREKPEHMDTFYTPSSGAINSALVAVNAAVTIVDTSSGVTHNGFQTAAPGNYIDYPVVITKGELKEKIRHHIARFYGSEEINPLDQTKWTRPVRLHRRDPKAPAPGQKAAELDAQEMELEEDKEKQRLLREQRQAQRAAEMSEIAPSQPGQPAKKFGKDQKKFVEVRRKDETKAKQAASQLSYEEALPWHFEDDENKQIWVGTYEAALSEMYAQFQFKAGKVHLTPVEKWYKFTQQRIFKTEEEMEAFIKQAEAKQKKLEASDPKILQRYAAKEKERDEKKRRDEESRGLREMGGKRTANFNTSTKYKADRDDHDELDFDEDVADDEEDPDYDADEEEAKEAKKRIKKDQLKANIFNLKDEHSYEEEEEEERKAREARKLIGKDTSKLLIKKEENALYASDADTTDDEASEPAVKKEEDAEKPEVEKPNVASGSSSKGTNTPSDRKEKHSRDIRSQELSEASGNESSRKKRKKNGVTSNLASGVNTPNGTTPRSLSPGPTSGGLKPPLTKTNSSLKRSRPVGAGSGSDGEGAGSGGEMSDGSRKRLKTKASMPNSKNVSPNGSRATSPSRETAAQPAKPLLALPTVEEVQAAVPEGGVIMKTFLEKWRPLMNSPQKAKFMEFMRTVVRTEKRGDISWVLVR